jgi:hypothetical protein
MATLNIVTKKLTYAGSDERLISNTRNLLSAVADHCDDKEIQQSATTAYNALQYVLKHIADTRTK